MTRAEFVEYVKHPKGMIAGLQKQLTKALEAVVQERQRFDTRKSA
jgi:hypothetical protein